MTGGFPAQRASNAINQEQDDDFIWSAGSITV